MDTQVILSMDGGGLRGLAPARVLCEIERRSGRPIGELFDYIAGTSIGGVLALGLTKPSHTGAAPEFSAAELYALLEHYATATATTGSNDDPSASSRGLSATHDDLRARALEACFGDVRLREACTNVLVTAYDIEHQRPFQFKSWSAVDPEHDFSMLETAYAASASPMHFLPARLHSRNGTLALIDGGVCANNPALCIYTRVITRHPNSEVLLVSLGTGRTHRPVDLDEVERRGRPAEPASWLDVLFEGPSAVVDEHLALLLSARAGLRRYYRFQPELTGRWEDFEASQPDALHSLVQVTERMIREQSERLDELVERLLTAKHRRHRGLRPGGAQPAL